MNAQYTAAWLVLKKRSSSSLEHASYGMKKANRKLHALSSFPRHRIRDRLVAVETALRRAETILRTRTVEYTSHSIAQTEAFCLSAARP
jgi:hypothetical protein